MPALALSEEDLCAQISEYLRRVHSGVLFHFDFGSGLKMTMGQAVRQKRLNPRAWPDLFIAHPAFFPETVNPTHGLFVELKREGVRLKKQNGDWASEHIREQADVLERLAQLGYIAQFACGYDETITIIDSYLTNSPRQKAT